MTRGGARQVRSAVPMYLLSRKIKAGGFKVVLSGEGADEIYGGYLFFRARCTSARPPRPPACLPPVSLEGGLMPAKDVDAAATPVCSGGLSMRSVPSRPCPAKQ